MVHTPKVNANGYVPVRVNIDGDKKAEAFKYKI